MLPEFHEDFVMPFNKRGNEFNEETRTCGYNSLIPVGPANLNSGNPRPLAMQP